MRVTKRNGTFEDVQFDKITWRISHLAHDLRVEPVLVAQKVCSQIVDLIQTSQLDEIAAQNCISMYTIHPDYTVLGSRIVIDNHHKNTSPSFVDVTKSCSHLLAPDYIDCVVRNAAAYETMLDYERDFLLDYFSLKTLMKSYLFSCAPDVVAERPQHMWMRIAVFLHRDDLELVKETYDLMSQKFFTHASPTLFNAGTTRPQLSSCFVAGTTVMTVHDGPIPIEDVHVGHQVVTHLGRIKSVVQRHVNPTGDRSLYKVMAYHTKPFVVTDNHKLRVYNSTTTDITWKRVDQLICGSDFLCTSTLHAETGLMSAYSFKVLVDKYIFTDKRVMGYENWKGYETANRGSIFTGSAIMHPDVMWMCGLCTRYATVMYDYFKTDEGVGAYVDKVVQQQRIHGIKFSFPNVLSEQLMRKIERVLQHHFGVAIHEMSRECETGKHLKVTNLFLGIVVETMLLNIPSEFFVFKTPLVQAWFSGFMADQEDVLFYRDHSMVIDVSRLKWQFLDRMYHWLKCHGIDTGYPERRQLSSLSMVCIEVNPYTSMLTEYTPPCVILSQDIRRIDNMMFVRVQYVTREYVNTSPPSAVYTLGIEDDHSYGVHGIFAQNCFLTNMEDSVDGIFKTLADCAQISKWAGGLGINISNIRGNKSVIRGTHGVSSGIMPMLKTYNAVGRYINQCFVPTTIVYTFDGPKYIKDIVAKRDSVLTHDGTFQTVQTVFKRDCPWQELVEIRNTYTLYPVQCTIQHQLYVSKDGGETLTYVSADEVIPGDLMYFPWPSVMSEPHPELTQPVCRFYALHFLLSHRVSNGDTYTLTIHTKFEQTIEFLDSIIDEHLDSAAADTSDYKLYQYTSKDVDIASDVWQTYFEPLPDCPDRSNIHVDFLNLPRDQLIHVVAGLMETRVDLSTNRNKVFNLFFMHANQFLVETLRYMFLRLNVLVYGNYMEAFKAYIINVPIHPNIEDVCTLLSVSNAVIITHHVTWIDSPNDKRGVLVEVKDVQRTMYGGDVYDLNVSNNRNYTTHMGLVHNSGKRLGSFAVYIEPWHVDIFDFLSAKKSQGAEEERARDLFYGLWIPDLFMRRVKENGVWSLMCPDGCPGLTKTYGTDFETLYTRYETEERYVRQVQARKIWDAIIESQIESGNPYMLYKDHVNRKNPQANIGVIQQSNLCTEIVLYTDKDHISVCNLASIALPSFVVEDTNTFDFEKLEHVVSVVTRNLNKVIDMNYYPVPEGKTANSKHRPIGIGVQGLADVFIMLHMAFDEPDARELNRRIFETMYYAALKERLCIVAQRDDSCAPSSLKGRRCPKASCSTTCGELCPHMVQTNGPN